MENKPYIKRPLNSFMLFQGEQRQKVVQDLQITNCAIVNMELGRRWNNLSEVDKAPYFEQAQREKMAHEAKYPGWTARDNYGKKAKAKAKQHAFHIRPASPQAQNHQAPAYQPYHIKAEQVPPHQAGPHHAPPNQTLNHQVSFTFVKLVFNNQNPVQVPPKWGLSNQAPDNPGLTNKAPNDTAPDDRAPINQVPKQEHPAEEIIIID